MQIFRTIVNSLLLGILLQVILGVMYGIITGYTNYTGICFNGDSLNTFCSVPASMIQGAEFGPVLVGVLNFTFYGFPTIIAAFIVYFLLNARKTAEHS